MQPALVMPPDLIIYILKRAASAEQWGARQALFDTKQASSEASLQTPPRGRCSCKRTRCLSVFVYSTSVRIADVWAQHATQRHQRVPCGSWKITLAVGRLHTPAHAQDKQAGAQCYATKTLGLRRQRYQLGHVSNWHGFAKRASSEAAALQQPLAQNGFNHISCHTNYLCHRSQPLQHGKRQAMQNKEIHKICSATGAAVQQLAVRLTTSNRAASAWQRQLRQQMAVLAAVALLAVARTSLAAALLAVARTSLATALLTAAHTPPAAALLTVACMPPAAGLLAVAHMPPAVALLAGAMTAQPNSFDGHYFNEIVDGTGRRGWFGSDRNLAVAGAPTEELVTLFAADHQLFLDLWCGQYMEMSLLGVDPAPAGFSIDDGWFADADPPRGPGGPRNGGPGGGAGGGRPRDGNDRPGGDGGPGGGGGVGPGGDGGPGGGGDPGGGGGDDGSGGRGDGVRRGGGGGGGGIGDGGAGAGGGDDNGDGGGGGGDGGNGNGGGGQGLRRQPMLRA
eukprot:366562-Chlamydomonas_euryale.AAC.8